MARTTMSVSKTVLAAFVLLNLSLPVLAQGTQFITGACTSDADCAGGCCGFNSGKCAGAVIAQERDGGCGFGDAQPNDNAAQAGGAGGAADAAAAGGAADGAAAGGAADAAAAGGAADGAADGAAAGGAADAAAAGGAAAGGAADAAGAGTQFITGDCTSDADCAGACCGFNSGKCAGAVIAQERDGGCGFGDAQPNDNAAQALNRRFVKFGRIARE